MLLSSCFFVFFVYCIELNYIYFYFFFFVFFFYFFFFVFFFFFLVAPEASVLYISITKGIQEVYNYRVSTRISALACVSSQVGETLCFHLTPS